MSQESSHFSLFTVKYAVKFYPHSAPWPGWGCLWQQIQVYPLDQGCFFMNILSLPAVWWWLNDHPKAKGQQLFLNWTARSHEWREKAWFHSSPFGFVGDFLYLYVWYTSMLLLQLLIFPSHTHAHAHLQQTQSRQRTHHDTCCMPLSSPRYSFLLFPNSQPQWPSLFPVLVNTCRSLSLSEFQFQRLSFALHSMRHVL